MAHCPNCNTKLLDDLRIVQSTPGYRCKNCGKRLKLQKEKKEDQAPNNLGANFEDLNLDLLNDGDVVSSGKPKERRKSSRDRTAGSPRKDRSPVSSIDSEAKKERRRRKEENKKATSGPESKTKQNPVGSEIVSNDSNSIGVEEVLEPVESLDVAKTANQVMSTAVEAVEVPPVFSSDDPFDSPSDSEVKESDLFLDSETEIQESDSEPEIGNLPTIVLGDPGRKSPSVSYQDDGQEDDASVWGLGFLVGDINQDEKKVLLGRDLRKELEVSIKPFSCPICESPLMAKAGRPGEKVKCSTCESVVPVPASFSGRSSTENLETQVGVESEIDDAPLEIPDEPVSFQSSKEQAFRSTSSLTPAFDSSQELRLADEEPVLAPTTPANIGDGLTENISASQQHREPGVLGVEELEVVGEGLETVDGDLGVDDLDLPQLVDDLELPETTGKPYSFQESQGEETGDLQLAKDSGEVLEPETISGLYSVSEDSSSLKGVKENGEGKDDSGSPAMVSPDAIPPVAAPPAFSASNTASGGPTKPRKQSVFGGKNDLSPTEQSFFFEWVKVFSTPAIAVTIAAQFLCLSIFQIVCMISDSTIEQPLVRLITKTVLLLPMGIVSVMIAAYAIGFISDHLYRQKEGWSFDRSQFFRYLKQIGLPLAISFLFFGGLIYLSTGNGVAGLATGGLFGFVLSPFVMIPSLYQGEGISFGDSDVSLAKKEEPDEWYKALFVWGLMWFLIIPFGVMGTVLTYAGFGIVIVPATALYLSAAMVLFGITMTRFLDICVELAKYRN